MTEGGTVELEEWIDLALMNDQLRVDRGNDNSADEENGKRPQKIEIPKFTREQFLQLHRKAMHVKSHAILQNPPRSPRKPPLPKLSNNPSPRRQISQNQAQLSPKSSNFNSFKIKDEYPYSMMHTQESTIMSISPSPRVQEENEKVQSLLTVIDRLLSQRKKDQHQEFFSGRSEGKELRLQNWERQLQRVEELLSQLRMSYSDSKDSSDDDFPSSRLIQATPDTPSPTTRSKSMQVIKQTRSNSANVTSILPVITTTILSSDASNAIKSNRNDARSESPINHIARLKNTNRSPSPTSPARLTKEQYSKARASRQKEVSMRRKEIEENRRDGLEKRLLEKDNKQLDIYRSIFEKIQHEKHKLACDWNRLHCQRIWLIAVSLVRRHMALVHSFKQARENHEKVGKMIICAIKIQRLYRRHTAKKQANREIMAIHIVYRLVRRYVKRWKFARKKAHAELIIVFLKSCRGISQAVLGVKKFLRRVKQIQNVWRTYRVQLNSQFELLSLQWDKVEQIIFSFLRDNHGINFLRIPKSKLKLKSLVEVQHSKIVGGSSRTVPNQSLLPIYRFTLNRSDFVAKPVSGAKTTPRYSPARGATGNSSFSYHKFRQDEYISPISRDIKMQLLKPYIEARRHKYREALLSWSRELGHISNTREKMQSLLRRSSNSTMGFFAERYRASCDIAVGRPFLQLLMKPEDMQHMIEQGYLILEQERKLDEYVYHK